MSEPCLLFGGPLQALMSRHLLKPSSCIPIITFALHCEPARNLAPSLDGHSSWCLNLVLHLQPSTMQNPLRRPHGHIAPQRRQPAFDPNHDAERGGPRGDSAEGVMSQGVRGHFVAMVARFPHTYITSLPLTSSRLGSSLAP